MNTPHSVAPKSESAAFAKSLDDRLFLAGFSLVFGLLAAVLSGYAYGSGDQSNQLPLIFREIDPGYLINDAFLNAQSGFSVRFYYVQLIASAGELIPLPALFICLHVIIYIAVTAITAFAAKDITGSNAAGVLAAGFAVSLQPFNLGVTASVTDLIKPAQIAMPFALLGLWRGVRGEATHAAIASIPALLMHPVFGAEAGGIALLAAGARQTLLLNRLAFISRFRDMARGVLVFFGASALFWALPMFVSGRIDPLSDRQLFDAYVYLRNPHHLLPSAWPAQNFLLGASFLGSVVISFIAYMQFSLREGRGYTHREHGAKMLPFTVVIAVPLAGLFAGWIFVEIIPTRLGAIAQLSRLTQITAWAGWMLIAWSIAAMLVRKELRWAGLTLIASAAAPALLFCKSSVFAGNRLRGGAAMRSALFYVAVALAVAVALFWTPRTSSALLPDIFQIGAAFGVAVLVALRPMRAPLALAALSCALPLSIAAFALERYGALPEIPRVSHNVRFIQPAFTIDAYAEKEAAQPSTQLALAAKSATAPDAVFLIPWTWKTWRIFSDRAVVVDRKGIPHDTDAMKEWRDRYFTIYDRSEGAGYPYHVTKPELLALQARYGFQYAVLPEDRAFSYPVIAEASGWVLVRVDGAP